MFPESVVNDEESSLLVEAVSLLVQRQREAEVWLAEQFRQTLLSDSALDRRMAELEERLGRIQARLGTLAAEVDPNLASAGDIARLEQGLQSLTNGAAGFPARPQTLTVVPSQTPSPSMDLPPRLTVEAANGARPRGPVNGAVRHAAESRSSEDADAAPGHVAPAYAAVGDAAAGGAGPRRASAWDVFGATPRERWGLALMGGGALALLYLVLRGLGFS
jgi:hypothetical protein